MFKYLALFALLAVAYAAPKPGLVSYSALPAVSAYSAYSAYPAVSAYSAYPAAVTAYGSYPVAAAYSAYAPYSAYVNNGQYVRGLYPGSNGYLW